MPPKAKETPAESRQRRAQTAVLAIAESDDPSEVRWQELFRLKRFAEHHMREIMTVGSGVKDDDFEVRTVVWEVYGMQDGALLAPHAPPCDERHDDE